MDRCRLLISWFAILVCQFSTECFAENYPTRVVRLIVPFSAGSGTDTIGRLIASGMTPSLGQQVIVDNRAGAAGNIGAELAAKAAPDGYTVLLVNLGHAANVSLYKNLPYDLTRDFSAVTQIASSPAVVVVHPSLPAKSLADLTKLAKSKPGAINYSSGGAGTPMFVATELFKGQAGIDLQHIPYKSGGEALTAVIAGEASVFFSPVATALPHIKSGRLRGLAITSPRRLALLTDLPTIAESGYPGYQSGNWYGLVVPAKTPREIIVIIRTAAVTMLGNPSVNKQLQDLGYVTIGDQPEEFAAHIKSEIGSLAKIMQRSGVKAD